MNFVNMGHVYYFRDLQLMLRNIFVILSLILLSATLQAATVITADTITNPDHFAGFESLPATTSYGASHTEDNILIEQINGNPNQIATVVTRPGQEGVRSWYPWSGDRGYTKITRADGGDIEAIGLLRSSGSSGIIDPKTMAYELYNDGVRIQFDALVMPHLYGEILYIGFTGGGFDELRIRDGLSPLGVGNNIPTNYLWIDAIEIINASAPALLGDCDASENISIADVTCSINIVLGDGLPNGNGADVDNNGSVDISDVVSIINLVPVP